MKVLILAVPIGSGHMKAAQSVNKALKELKPDIEIRFENCFQWVWPFYGKVYKSIYEFCQKKSRALLKLFYGGVGIKSGSSDFMYRVHKVLAYKFTSLLEEYKPDYVLCTHFSPGYFSALYKKIYRYRIGVVVTDYYVHPHWVNREIDDYFIPHEFLTDQVVTYAGRSKRVYSFGIPVALELEAGVDVKAARKRFKLSKNRISVTVMGSRVFGGEWFEIVKEIVDFDYDLLVLCGENTEVMEKIRNLKGKATKQTLGMVKKIHELVGTTDVLITKAGGITTTEATKVGPCLLFANSIVGLEDKNEDFLIEHGAALKIDENNAKEVIADLLAHPEKMAEMRKNLKNIGKTKSAKNIARVILDQG